MEGLIAALPTLWLMALVGLVLTILRSDCGAHLCDHAGGQAAVTGFVKLAEELEG